MSNSSRTRLNKGIREMIPGGSELLDLLEISHKMTLRNYKEETGEIVNLFHKKLSEIADLMRDAILDQQKEGN